MKVAHTAELFLRRGGRPAPAASTAPAADARTVSEAERRAIERRAPLPSLPGDEEVPPFLRPERRLRARRGRRGWGRHALVAPFALSLLATGLVWIAFLRVMSSEHLRVAHLEVKGGRFLSEGEVKNLLGPAVGENILRLDIEALKARLRASPWVADATVVRTLPDTLRVEIRERLPLALAQVDRLYLMDDEGELVDIYGPSTAGFDLPIVRGLPGLPADVRRERAQRAGALLRDLGAVAAEISEVEPLADGDLRVVLRGPGEVLLLGSGPWRARVTTFLALRRQLDERVPTAEHFDLRFRDRIIARPVAGAETPAVTASPAAPAPSAPRLAPPAAIVAAVPRVAPPVAATGDVPPADPIPAPAPAAPTHAFVGPPRPEPAPANPLPDAPGAVQPPGR